jgi:hypothetical protein
MSPLRPFAEGGGTARSGGRLSFVAAPLVGRGGARGDLEMLQPKNAWLGAAEFERGAGRESIMVWAHLLSLGHRARV